MQHAPHTTRPASPLTVPHAFRRTTGAHAIIASILVADLLGVLIWVLLGAFSGPPIWWLLRAFVHLLHASLGFDLILILVLGGVASRSFLQSWAIPGTLMVLIVVITCVLWVLQPGWMLIPSPIPAFVPREAPSWRLLFVPQGAVIAASLSLLAHMSVLRHAHNDATTQPLSFSRAHPDGPIWRLTEQAYALYRQALTRFQPSPLPHLKTPPTFYYYHKQVNPDVTAPPDPEQELYWEHGNLVVNRGYLGPKDEQVDILLPLLARLLYDTNTPTPLVLSLFDLAHSAEGSCLTAWLLAFPLSVQQTSEERWKTLERERELDRDWFAYICGQGPQLRRLLRRRLEEQMQSHVPDTSTTTLAERIDHLDSLMDREAQQREHLRATVSSLTPPAS